MDQALQITRDVVYAEPIADVPLALDLYRPAGESLPVIMLVHGGGWCVGCRQDFEGYARLFAAEGYLAIAVSYRLAPVHPFPAACADVRAAAGWIAAHAADYGGDPAHIGAYGVSAGGHLVSWLATDPATPLTCVVEWAGPMDMRREPITYPYRGYTMAFMGACVHDRPTDYDDASPLSRLSAGMPPTLLIHGLADEVVPVAHARWMHEAAQQLGAPVAMVLLDGVGHTGGDPYDPLHAPGWQAMMAFFAQHLRE